MGKTFSWFWLALVLSSLALLNHVDLIFDTLHFRSINERKATISDAHNDTFYTTDKLTLNTILQTMERAHPGIRKRFVDKITSKACGVFLWVVLVVSRLETWLRNYESSAEMEGEIDSLSSDLERLYEHMLESQTQQHRLFGSKYL